MKTNMKVIETLLFWNIILKKVMESLLFWNILTNLNFKKKLLKNYFKYLLNKFWEFEFLKY